MRGPGVSRVIFWHGRHRCPRTRGVAGWGGGGEGWRQPKPVRLIMRQMLNGRSPNPIPEPLYGSPPG